MRRTEQIVLVGQVPAEGGAVKWALTRMEGAESHSRSVVLPGSAVMRSRRGAAGRPAVHASIRLQEAPARDLCRNSPPGSASARTRAARCGAVAQHGVDMAGVLHQPLHLRADRAELGHRELGQRRLELGELLAGELGDTRPSRGRPARRRCPAGCRRRAASRRRPARLRHRQRIGLGAADLLGDRVGVVGQVDARVVRRVGLAHLLGAVAQAHDARRRAEDQRLGDREEVRRVEVVVELDARCRASARGAASGPRRPARGWPCRSGCRPPSAPDRRRGRARRSRGPCRPSP